MKKQLFIIILICVGCFSKAQSRSVGGTVIDSVTNKPMEYIAVYMEKTSIGCVTNYDGEFYLNDNSGKNVLVVDAVGYKTRRIVLKPGQATGMKIKLQPESIRLEGAIVKPKKEKYTKKENPAVALIRKVIENKDNSIIEKRNAEEFISNLAKELNLAQYTPQANSEALLLIHRKRSPFSHRRRLTPQASSEAILLHFNSASGE